jgi:alkaline phosphatase D
MQNPFLRALAVLFITLSFWLESTAQGVFQHGVASGDPLPDAVIVWTRVTPPYPADSVRVHWEMALDEHFTHIEQAGETVTSAARDFTVKTDAQGLMPGTFYYYRFEAFGEKSTVGRTKTAGVGQSSKPALFASLATPKNRKPPLPSPNEQVRLAVVSCSNYEGGFFNAYARIASIEDLDAVVHLGDYIYEYAPKQYGDSTLQRSHLPENELLTLADYRTRYAQYRSDPDLQAAHRMHPFICVWDDHEIANDAHAEGAENHQPGEGDFSQRKLAATKAYYEWLPVREGKTLYRQFSFGGVADLFMLDERLAGREKQTDSKRPKKLNAERPMLGKEQLEWLKRGLKTSGATWKILGNQVLFAELNVMPVFRKAYVHFDAWDGYPVERQAIKDFIAENEVQNLVIATGDTHSSWCFDIPLDFKKYRKRRNGKIVAHEFATPSISSANFDEYKGEKTVDFIEKTFASPAVNPHLRYLDLRNHGYLLLTLTPYDAVAEWRFVESLKYRTEGEFVGEKRLIKAEVVMPLRANGEASVGGK